MAIGCVRPVCGVAAANGNPINAGVFTWKRVGMNAVRARHEDRRSGRTGRSPLNKESKPRPGAVGEPSGRLSSASGQLLPRNMDPKLGCLARDRERQRSVQTGKGSSSRKARGVSIKRLTPPGSRPQGTRAKKVRRNGIDRSWCLAKAAPLSPSLGARTLGVEAKHPHETKMPGCSLQRHTGGS